MIPAQLQPSKRWKQPGDGCWFHPAVVEEAAHDLFHGWCNSPGWGGRKEGRKEEKEGARERERGEKRWKKACTHPGHCNCHGVYNCCTLLCSLYGSPLQPSASVTLSLQLAAGHSAVVVVVVDSRGGWRRGETGEISLRFHGADLNRRKGGRDGWLRWEESGLASALFSARNRATFRNPRDVSRPNEFPHRVNEFSTSRWKLSCVAGWWWWWSLVPRNEWIFRGLFFLFSPPSSKNGGGTRDG